MTEIDFPRRSVTAPPPAVEHEYDAETPASIAVVEAVCMLEDVDPLESAGEIQFVLHDHFDPAALDAITGSGTGQGGTIITFEIPTEQAYRATVRDDGRIVVRRIQGA